MNTPQELRNARRHLGWTQAQLAEALGVDPLTVSRWERGTVQPNWTMLSLALEALTR